MWQITSNQKKQITIIPNVLNYKIPATLISGKYHGPTIVITAGIHSGEYPGISASIQVAKKIDPAKVHGKILFMHCVNVSGFWAKTSAVLPEDHGNLNNNYPGSPIGTESMRIADYFVKNIFPQTDFLLDLHSGGGREPLTPCLFFPTSPKVREKSLETAKALNIPYLIESSATHGEYSYAANVLGIPALLLERGHSQQCLKEWIDDYENDIFLLLNHLKVYEYISVKPICEKKIFHKTIYLTAEEDGLWYANVHENQLVYKGECLGHIEDFFGHKIKEYYAQEEGIVFYYTSGLPVKKGTSLVAYGLLSSLSQ